MARRRAEGDVVYRVLFRYTDGTESATSLGPYGTAGAAKGQATHENNRLYRHSDGEPTGKYVAQESETVWKDVE